MADSAASRAHQATVRHIERVRELLKVVTDKLTKRAWKHDQSKFEHVEASKLAELQAHIDAHGPAKYGTPEYGEYSAILGPMLEHHYAANSHHPEHYDRGVAGMDLFDVVEMFCDWKAASERGGEEVMNLTAAMERYEIHGQLRAIFENTAYRLGWPYR